MNIVITILIVLVASAISAAASAVLVKNRQHATIERLRKERADYMERAVVAETNNEYLGQQLSANQPSKKRGFKQKWANVMPNETAEL